MALDWLKSSLMSRRGYTKAIEQLQQQLSKRRNDPRLQLKLAELYVQAGRPKDALPLFEAVADDFALQGFAARAIAILKRIKNLDPSHGQAEEKLAYLISQQDNPAPSPWRAKAQESADLEIGMEAIDDSSPGMEAIGSEPPAASSEVPAVDLSDDSVRHEFLELIDLAFSPAAPAAAPSAGGVAASPLFGDFRPDELVAVMSGLQLSTFEPGEIIVSQGESGRSLFVLASGQARVYLKDKSGRSVQARELGEGDFFGEIALMVGGSRTATITARTRCELLELGRAELDAVAKAHPRVRDVLQQFYATRVNTSVDALGAS